MDMKAMFKEYAGRDMFDHEHEVIRSLVDNATDTSRKRILTIGRNVGYRSQAMKFLSYIYEQGLYD